MVSSHISAIKEKEGRSNCLESIGRLLIWSGLHSFDFLLCLYSTLLPQAGQQLELCWRTSWESHPSEELSELQCRSINIG